jgi:hypothetical protein
VFGPVRDPSQRVHDRPVELPGGFPIKGLGRDRERVSFENGIFHCFIERIANLKDARGEPQVIGRRLALAVEPVQNRCRPDRNRPGVMKYTPSLMYRRGRNQIRPARGAQRQQSGRSGRQHRYTAAVIFTLDALVASDLKWQHRISLKDMIGMMPGNL